MATSSVEVSGLRDGHGRLVSFAHIASFGPISPVAYPPEHFVVFVAADASLADGPTLMSFVEPIVRAGCVYAVCWGPDSSSMEDAFDFADIEVHGEADPSHVVMTTSHNDESLEEALCFVSDSARPVDRYVSTCKHLLVIVVAGVASEAVIRGYFERHERGAG